MTCMQTYNLPPAHLGVPVVVDRSPKISWAGWEACREGAWSAKCHRYSPLHAGSLELTCSVSSHIANLHLCLENSRVATIPMFSSPNNSPLVKSNKRSTKTDPDDMDLPSATTMPSKR